MDAFSMLCSMRQVASSFLLALLAFPAVAQLDFADPVRVDSNGLAEELRPALAGDGDGVWIASWHAYGVGDAGSDSNIVFARSEDAGLTWSPATTFDSDPASEAVDELEPSIATNRRGRWVTVWHAFESVGLPSGNGPNLYVSRSSDNGRTWSEPEWIDPVGSQTSRSDSGAEVITDRHGVWICIWEVIGAGIGVDHDIYMSRSENNGADWSTPVLVNTDGAADSRMDIDAVLDTDEAGLWVACWAANDDFGGSGDFDLLFSRSSDDGVTWSDPELLNTNGASDSGDDRTPSIATNGEGTWIAVWTATDFVAADTEILYSISSDNAQTWSAPTTLDPIGAASAGSDGFTSIATDRAGLWAVVWASANPSDTDWDLWTTESSDDGTTWSEPRLLDSARASDGEFEYERSFRLSTDRSGVWLSAWTEGDGVPLRGFLTGVEVRSANAFAEVDGGGGNGGCFIATAAYGTPLAAQLDQLRSIRDRRLLETAFGVAFTEVYYRLSPPLAKWISARPAARAMVRGLVLLALAVDRAPVSTAVALAVILSLVWQLRRRYVMTARNA